MPSQFPRTVPGECGAGGAAGELSRTWLRALRREGGQCLVVGPQLGGSCCQKATWGPGAGSGRHVGVGVRALCACLCGWYGGLPVGVFFFFFGGV